MLLHRYLGCERYDESRRSNGSTARIKRKRAHSRDVHRSHCSRKASHGSI